MSIEGVFFDLDGTLLDTAPDLATALNTLLGRKNRAQIDYQHVRKVTSNGANALLQLGFHCLPGDPGHSELREELLACYLDTICVGTRPFAGIHSLLKRLGEHNIIWGIVTNKPWRYTDALLRELDFPYAPATVVCPDHVDNKKPAPDALWLACQEAGTTPSTSIYIGDHLRDIECGINAGCKTIAVGYGYISEPDDYLHWNADHCVAHADEIWPLIAQYNQHPKGINTQ